MVMLGLEEDSGNGGEERMEREIQVHMYVRGEGRTRNFLEFSDKR